MLPQLGNSLTVIVGDETSTIEVPHDPTSYAAQLQVFVDAVRSGAALLTGPEDSVANMRAIDAMYVAAGLQPRD